MNNTGKMATGWTILIVLIIVVGGYFIITSDSVDTPDATTDTSTTTDAEMMDDSEDMDTSDDSEATMDGDNTVTYTGDGFSPSSITVSQGDTVTFVNDSDSQGMWVASAMHPTHEVYSGTTRSEHCQDGMSDTFDACSNVPAGESWSFTFDQAGEWNYHNHSMNSHTGTVIVE